jgi:hypothetical protein
MEFRDIIIASISGKKYVRSFAKLVINRNTDIIAAGLEKWEDALLRMFVHLPLSSDLNQAMAMFFAGTETQPDSWWQGHPRIHLILNYSITPEDALDYHGRFVKFRFVRFMKSAPTAADISRDLLSAIFHYRGQLKVLCCNGDGFTAEINTPEHNVIHCCYGIIGHNIPAQYRCDANGLIHPNKQRRCLSSF